MRKIIIKPSSEAHTWRGLSSTLPQPPLPFLFFRVDDAQTVITTPVEEIGEGWFRTAKEVYQFEEVSNERSKKRGS